MEAQTVLSRLHEKYPDARYYLDFSNPLELMVAAILAPQVKDTLVNAATPALFAGYRTARQYADADLEELVGFVRKISFSHQKAERIQQACRILDEKYGGAVPDRMEDLVQIPGIGRKTAHAILINAFDKVLGISVDTHVIRLAHRLGLSAGKTPEKIEEDLMGLFAKEEWKKLPWVLKKHGQKVCKAPVPACSSCFLADLCPKTGVDKST